VKKVNILLALGMLSSQVLAQHSIGLGAGVGEVDVTSHKPDLDQRFLIYRYEFSPNWSAHGEYIQLKSDDFYTTVLIDMGDGMIIDESVTTKVEIDTWVLGLRRDYEFNQSHAVYAMLGINFYDFDVKETGLDVRDETGTAMAASVGWQYKFNSSWSTNLEYQYLDFEDSKATSFKLGLNFHF